ncbi:hypothetical protein SAMN04487768_2752 [Burkholderia sp. b13]|nr:hypothetical protein SAMN04487768_2752 [Burkholderia sp. b13]
MLVRALIAAMDRWDKAGIWVYSLNTLRLLFPENERAMLKALARHERAGLITHVARGLYVNLVRGQCHPMPARPTSQPLPQYADRL